MGRKAHPQYVLMAALGVCALIIVVPVVMRFVTSPYIFDSMARVPQAEMAVVLGASVYQGKPSPVLERRAAQAVALYNAQKVTKILVTGDSGALSHDEVTPVHTYLMQAGVPPEAIELDYAGYDTYSSMYRAKDQFGATSVIIVTQDFHLPRAVFIARRLGLQAFGLVATGDGSRKDYAREIPASSKALLDLLMHRIPEDTRAAEGEEK